MRDEERRRRALTTAELLARKPEPEAFARLPRAPLQVIFSNVRGLANVGLAFRLCDNLRAEHLWLCGITGHPARQDDPRPPEVVERSDREIRRTAVMAVPFVPWSWAPEALPVATRLRAQGYRLVVLEQAEGSVPLHRADLRGPLCLAFGHERLGVEKELLEQADLVLELPVWGMANSINVAMALGIVGYEAMRQNAGYGLPPL
ncbi:MAG TPA: TrmH family RNA methyltransferase [Fredinandcohnia sp.]|nr:TrmH family RNA methyltransferase [Fredinandcohnia sp.]